VTARGIVEDPALLRRAAEDLADRFEPALCNEYAALFSEAIAIASPGLDASHLRARYERIRRPRSVRVEPKTIFVLSRVTLGADVAVTSVLLDAAKRRFPAAQIVFAGAHKNFELFAGDPRIKHMPVVFPRSGLRDQLALQPVLREAFCEPESIVLDPDSRISQLGLLPVCAEENYFFFESRAYGGESAASLPELAAEWAKEILGVQDARPYVALPLVQVPQEPYVAVSLGVGGNPAKRIPDPFERNLLQALAARYPRICIDRGAGGEEAARVDAAIRGLDRVSAWDGSFAGFAGLIAASKLYIGYDSAGQHVASAAGVPLLSVFAGFPCARFFDRWRPKGCVIRVEESPPDAVLAETLAALNNIKL
jgi:ADP-heptose:LPS heptosyltransferase